MKLNSRMKRILVIAVTMGAVIGMLITMLAAKSSLNQKEKEFEAVKAELTAAKEELSAENQMLKEQMTSEENTEHMAESAQKLASDDEDWSLVLINEEYPLDTSYVPELEELESDKSVDKRIADDAKQMISEAGAEGLNFYICSAYRSYEKQREVFDQTMQEWIYQGYSPLNAYEETKKSVAVPGTSEHASGLALDITSAQYRELDEKQAETAESKWLAQNSWKYGFILRYPPEKASVTGIIYEPWHYRYVGKEAAKEITERGITLEEYLVKMD